MRIFVTGGTGLLGNTVLRQLTDQGHRAVSLVRSQPDSQVFDGINTEFAIADLGETGSANRDLIFSAIKKCDAVIHSAGLIHLGWKRMEESLAVNRDGTRTIVDACCKFKVPMVHIGTVNAMAVGTRKKAANEETPLDNAGGQVQCSYVVSKRAGVEEVLAGTSRKLNSVILHPGFMLGPWDWKPSSGRMIVEVTKAWRPIAPSGGISICDSRDVASGTISALTQLLENRLESGRQYLLAGENWTYFELWKEIAQRAGRRGPIVPAGPAQRWVGQTAGDLISKFTRQESDLNSAAVKMSSQFHWYDSTRAKEELGYRWRDPRESVEDAVEWLQLQGMIARL